MAITAQPLNTHRLIADNVRREVMDAEAEVARLVAMLRAAHERLVRARIYVSVSDAIDGGPFA